MPTQMDTTNPKPNNMPQMQITILEQTTQKENEKMKINKQNRTNRTKEITKPKGWYPRPS
jgi:cell division protein FtsL